MSATTALIVRIPPPHVPPQSVTPWNPRGKCLVALPPAPRGPGRTLHEIYTCLGSAAEATANRAAHSWGLGPLAVAARLVEFFGEQHERELKIYSLLTNVPRKLHKDCLKLMYYALPSETAGTQKDAFQSIIDLTTRYPGLRAIFLDAKCVPKTLGAFPAENKAHMALASVWARDEDCGEEWDFFKNFAAACVADSDIAAIVGENPRQNARTDGSCTGLTVVERLLVSFECNGGDHADFSAPLAIRYLSGILELPSFWTQTGLVYEGVVRKVINQTILLLKDLGVDSSDEEEETGLVDLDGIDNLCTAILRGVRGWIEMRETPNGELADEFWFKSLVQLMKLLRQYVLALGKCHPDLRPRPKSENNLPNSGSIARSPEMERWIPTPYRIRVFTTLISPDLSSSAADLGQEPTKKHKPSTPRIFSKYLSWGSIPVNKSNEEDQGQRDGIIPADSSSEGSFSSLKDTFPLTTASGVVEILPSIGSKSVFTASEKVSGPRRRWRPWRAFALPALISRNVRKRSAESEGNPITFSSTSVDASSNEDKIKEPSAFFSDLADSQASDEPPHPSASSEPLREGLDLHTQDFEKLSNHVASSDKPTGLPDPDPDPLARFNELLQKQSKTITVGWEYSAEFSKPEGRPEDTLGEPLYTWSVSVLIDGEVRGRGTGRTKKAGKRAAVLQALVTMEGGSEIERASMHERAASMCLL